MSLATASFRPTSSAPASLVPSFLAPSSLIVGLLLAAGVVSASAQDFKPGLWEIRQKPQLDPQRQAQMEQMQKQMAALPPEQRRQMESMMSQHGVSMNFQGGEVLAGSRGADGRPRSTVQALLDGERPGGALQGSATTIGVIATDARLTKAQATKLAQIAHDGLARAIHPVHTVMDGDVMFALATGAADVDGDMTLLGAVAAEVVARAIVDAVAASQTTAATD